jgi:DNA helicase II / ATP-dependent DNA helicase PcrA
MSVLGRAALLAARRSSTAPWCLFIAFQLLLLQWPSSGWTQVDRAIRHQYVSSLLGMVGRSSSHAGVDRSGTVTDSPAFPLNPNQRAAVEAPIGNIRVRAGPGSGKTRVLVSRIVHLIRHEGVPADQILAVTFTRKAAMEMKHRIEQVMGSSTSDLLTLSTLHSLCSRLLREYSPYPANSYSVVADSEARSMIKQVLKEGKYDQSEYRPRDVQQGISLLKREGIAALNANTSLTFSEPFWGEINVILQSYQMLLQQSNAKDFDDLILDALTLLRSRPDIRKQVRSRYRHLLVDEWQDVDRAQLGLVKEIAGANGNDEAEKAESRRSLFVVGDSQQTIYSWRGADARNMDKLIKDYKSVQTFELVRLRLIFYGVVPL